MSRRTVRIGAQLLDEVARLLREEVTDPRIQLVTLTRMDVRPTCATRSSTTARSTKDGEPDVESLDAGLARARRPSCGAAPARVLPMKRMPELRFRYDPSLALGSKTLDLLRDLRDEGRADGAHDADESGEGETP